MRKEKDHAIIGLQDFPFLLPQRREGLTKPRRRNGAPLSICSGEMGVGLMSIGGDSNSPRHEAIS